MPVDSISTEYITLAFELEQHSEGLVDAYFGPPQLRQNGKQRHAAPRAPGAIADDLASLRRRVKASDYPHRRRSYLNVQLRALETMARKLAGEPLCYRDEVRSYFDIEPQHISESVFAEAATTLDALLPGQGTIAERLESWRQGFEVPPNIARQMIDRIVQEARARTSALVALPPEEAVTVEMVSDKPWSGYNWYLGDAHSRIEMNTDLPLRASSLLDLVCHEAYPGHHTEHALKEWNLYRQHGWGEHTIQLINTPECVISEGIATLAASIIFGDDAEQWMAREVYPLGGIRSHPIQEQGIAQAMQQLRGVVGNAALLLHEEGRDPEEVVQYLMRHSLCNEREARQRLRFLSTPLWRSYIFTYYVGHDLLRRWLARGDRHARFQTLLTQQVYPSLVEGWIIEEERHCPAN
jgi:hypothetical protein